MTGAGSGRTGRRAAGLVRWYSSSMSAFARPTSFAISALLVIGLVPAIRPDVEGDAQHWFARVREGFSFLVRDPLLRTLILIIGAVNVLMNPVFLVVLPVYADATTGQATDLGLLIGAFGVGSGR